jgi:hypothetical protein
METQIIRSNFKSGELTFGQREKFMNEEILRHIDNFRANGLYVQQHEIITKTGSSFSVKFDLVRVNS